MTILQDTRQQQLEDAWSEETTQGSGYLCGHVIILVDSEWVYEDTRTSTISGGLRPCYKCGLSCDDFDACLGMLSGVSNACCGHGITEQSYVQFKCGKTIRGFNRIHD